VTTIRLSKCILVFGVALFCTLVVFNNLTDYDSNFQFVRHVLQMDSTFPGNKGMWRAINSPALHHVAYDVVILWESLTAAMAWWGGTRLLRSLRGTAAGFHEAKAQSVVALTMGIVLWFVGFIAVGGEWYLMWQSKTWNGQDAAFRLVVVLGIVLLYVIAPEGEHG
jgi:predicted small integral membrane protein